MVITKLYIRNFRNIKEAELTFDDSLNIFVGKNAQGKTNLMEAISVCLGGSFRHVRYNQYIPVSDSGAEVFIRLCFREDNNTGRENIVEYTISNNKPQIRYNGLSVSDASKLYGVLKYVVFVPEHLNLIKGAPELRRGYLDDVAVMQTQTHLKKLSNYNRGLKQRNNILVVSGNMPEGELSANLAPWNEVLASEGINVTYGRLRYFAFLQEYAAEIYSRLTEETEFLKMEYCSSIFKTDSIDFNNVNTLFKQYVTELENNIQTEMKLRYTVAGVHRDDVNFFINGMNARDFASQGQLRSAALALKLSEAEIIRRRNKTCPVIILDDILSELDHVRRGFVINNIDNSQVFITCCNMDDLSALNGGRAWRTENGCFMEV
ncbi:MAG: DNA replication/repair protein RecF [Oscillospiraceae bacterium]